MLSRRPSTVTLSANTSWYLFNFRASTIRALAAAGYRVVCLSPSDDYGPRLAQLGCEWFPLPMDNVGTHPGRDMLLVGRFLRHYRHLKPAVAFHFTIKNNIYGTWAARALGVAAVNNVSGLGTAFIRPGLTGAIVRTLYRISQPLAHSIYCQNPDDFAFLRQRRLVPASKLYMLPGSGVDLQRFHPRLRTARPPNSPLRMLYAGRMLADKGLHELIDAVGRINARALRLELTLCGFSGARNVSAIDDHRLGQWSSRPGVRWLGPSDDMPDVYAQSDAVVLPSYREGVPRSLLEAAAMGLPIVTTDVPGCRHVVTHEINGLLCEARSSDALHRALERLLALTDAERLAMGAAGRARAEAEFDEQRVVQAALDVVGEVIEQRQQSGNR